MRVCVKLFASLRERAGWGERWVEIAAAPVSPSELWSQLAPELQLPAQLPAGIQVAINHAFRPAGTPLADGDELAFLPPISGG